MKRSLLFAAAMVPLLSFAQHRYTVRVNLPDSALDGAGISLMKRSLDPKSVVILARSVVDGDGCLLEGEVGEPLCATLIADRRFLSTLVVEAGDITVDVGPEGFEPEVSGTPVNEDWNRMYVLPYNELVASDTSFRRMSRIRRSGDVSKAAMAFMFRPENQALYNKVAANKLEFAEKYAASPFIFGMAYEYFVLPREDVPRVKTIVDKMTPDMRSELEGVHAKFMERMAAMQKNDAPEAGGDSVALGMRYKDFRGKTPSGDSLSLSTVVNGGARLTLVDFWASWCGPCKASMPHLKTIYGTYSDKGLAIVGVSTDRDEEAWRKAIDELGLGWPQMIGSAGPQLYGVRYIPFTVLIDRDGTVVGVNLRGVALENRIAALLGE